MVFERGLVVSECLLQAKTREQKKFHMDTDLLSLPPEIFAFQKCIEAAIFGGDKKLRAEDNDFEKFEKHNIIIQFTLLYLARESLTDVSWRCISHARDVYSC